ncbi:hypothetical protein Bca52824_018167 [Brassica carinata]|uniref:Uncharacterized protein n=1 Tax=Brassica carinata TaxID=52824 RepID=A0A8X7VQE2_BRACI|nr:hypothetical protein Bca52824_018167 [Brassica carinata]
MDSSVLNAYEVSKEAAEARKKSKIIKPVERRETPFVGLEASSSFGSSYRRKFPSKFEAVNNINGKQQRRQSRRTRLPAALHLEPLLNVQMRAAMETLTSSGLGPLQLEPRSKERVSDKPCNVGIRWCYGNVFTREQLTLARHSTF